MRRATAAERFEQRLLVFPEPSLSPMHCLSRTVDDPQLRRRAADEMLVVAHLALHEWHDGEKNQLTGAETQLA